MDQNGNDNEGNHDNFSSSNSHSSSRKRPRNDDQNKNSRPRYDRRQVQPTFWDATATVSATSFGARRLPEIKALWAAVQEREKIKGGSNNGIDDGRASNTGPFVRSDVASAALKSGGRKTSARHLRRRATSHKSRNRQRRNLSNRGIAATIDIAVVPSQGDGDTETGHTQQTAAPLCRRARRLTATRLQSDHDDWKMLQNIDFKLVHTAPDCDDDTANTKSPNDRDGKVHWIPTHVWHAKRMRIESLWGWKVPVMHTNRGCAAALRLVIQDDKCLVQDATWRQQPIWFGVDDSDTSATTTSTFQDGIRRIIPAFTWTMESDQCMMSSGEGMLHELDCFPAGAIAPIEWIMSRGRRLISTESDTLEPASTLNQRCYVYFFMHPSVSESARSQFRTIVQGATSSKTIQGPFHGCNGGVACITLRGSSSPSCLAKGLTEALSSTDSEVSSILDVCNEAMNANHGSCRFLPTMAESALPCLVRCIRPRDPLSSPTNWAVCGLDVYCHPSHTKSLFLALILRGGACPVGMAEEAHLAVECEPPLPVFPRDYPDTEQGRIYWTTPTTSDEWLLARNYWQGGGGRISISTKLPLCPQVQRVLRGNDIDGTLNESPIVVVRGAHCDPFRQALSNCAIIPSSPNTPNTTSLRRKRRPAGRTSAFTEAIRLSETDFASCKESCNLLLQALSLPAVLLCHVQVTGKGTLNPGAGLYPMGDDTDQANTPMGFVTAGAFSVARGRHHGVAIVRAALFLTAVASSREHQACVVGKRLNGTRELQLLIRFQQSPTTFHTAALSLLP